MIHARNCAHKEGKTDRYRFLRNRVKHEIRMAKEKYYKDNISGNHNKDSAKWWKKINKLTGRDKSNNFTLTDPESQSIMNDKDTANYINSFFVDLTKDFPVVQDKWLMNNETESLYSVKRVCSEEIKRAKNQ